jgi:hypothetical protein
LSITIKPIIKDILGENYEINFTFEATQQHTLPEWDSDPIVTPEFPGWNDNINFISEISEDEGFVFKSDVPFHNIVKWIDLKQDISGDVSLMDVQREFRLSEDNYTWSEWYELTLENMNKYAVRYSFIFLEFKYVAQPLEVSPVTEENKNILYKIPITKPTNIGWTTVISEGSAYSFEIGAPHENLIYKIGDYTLTPNCILFGTVLQTATNIPNAGDNIFINPLFQGIELDDITELIIEQVDSIIVENNKKTLYLKSVSLIADKTDDRVDALFTLTFPGERMVLTPPFLMKVFSITDYQLSVSGLTDSRILDIQYRYSANKKRWSRWEILTQENISTINIDKLSFFYIEVAFTRTGTDIDGEISIDDLVFIGDIQNVTADYQKINKFGLRSDCDYCDDCADDCADDNEAIEHWGDACKGTFNPYEIYKNVGVYNKLSNDVVNIYGWSVTYYTTSPDGAGKDRFLNEYQLYNYEEYKDIKVIPADNKFPESMLVMNGFDFALLESFEVHITKDIFKQAFGLNKRPAKKDKLWFCQANKLYQVEHSQSFKDFMNSSVYYKLKLKPATNDMAIGNVESTNLSDLMANNSHEALFGMDITNETKKITNKTFQDNLTEDVVRQSLKAPIVNYDLQNGANLISRNYYNFTTLTDNTAIVYEKLDTVLNEGDDRTFMCWFNISEMKDNQSYNFIRNKNKSNEGYDISYSNGNIEIELNNLYYEIDILLDTNKWYALMITFNQRQHKLEYAVYTRFGSAIPGTHSLNDLKLIIDGTEELEPQAWVDSNMVLKILGSPMYYTNMRIFSTAIPKDKHFKILNQYIIKDTSKLLISDNSNRKVITPKHRF